MDCRDCARYNEDATTEPGGSCRDRKLNPASWEDAVNVSQIYGIRSVCIFNDHRERLIATQLPVAGGGIPFPAGRKGPVRAGRSGPDPLDRDRASLR